MNLKMESFRTESKIDEPMSVTLTLFEDNLHSIVINTRLPDENRQTSRVAKFTEYCATNSREQMDAFEDEISNPKRKLRMSTCEERRGKTVASSFSAVSNDERKSKLLFGPHEAPLKFRGWFQTHSVEL